MIVLQSSQSSLIMIIIEWGMGKHARLESIRGKK
jgi:hypothetical protein